MDLLCVHLGRKFAVVAVYDRCVACRSDRITECVYHICELLNRKLQDIFWLYIHSDRILYIVSGYFFYCIFRSRLRFLHSFCLKIDIRSCLNSIVRSSLHIFLIIRIHGVTTLISVRHHLNKGEWYIICRNLRPVDISLPFCNTDAAEKRSLYCFSIIIHINTIYLFPCICRIRYTGIRGCLILLIITWSDLIRKRGKTALCDH